MRLPCKYLDLINLTHGLCRSVHNCHPNFVMYATFTSLARRRPIPPTALGVQILSQARRDKNHALSAPTPQKNLLVRRSNLVQRLAGGRKSCIMYEGNVEVTERIKVVRPTRERCLDCQPDNLVASFSATKLNSWVLEVKRQNGLPRYLPPCVHSFMFKYQHKVVRVTRLTLVLKCISDLSQFIRCPDH